MPQPTIALSKTKPALDALLRAGVITKGFVNHHLALTGSYDKVFEDAAWDAHFGVVRNANRFTFMGAFPVAANHSRKALRFFEVVAPFMSDGSISHTLIDERAPLRVIGGKPDVPSAWSYATFPSTIACGPSGCAAF